YNDNGTQLGAIQDSNYNLISQSNPAKRGQAIVIYANGLGPVTNQPLSGDPSPGAPNLATTATPTVTIGGRNAQVLFSGLTPGSVGLYQVNVDVPSDAATGLQPIVVSIGGVDSKASVLPVQ